MELFERPHISRNFVENLNIIRSFYQLLGNRIISQMRKEILRAFDVIVVTAEPKVALLKDINAKWVPLGNYNPHADVELAFHNQHWILNILLDHPSFHCVDILSIFNRLCVIHVILCICCARVRIT